jgi:hypothetical protein
MDGEKFAKRFRIATKWLLIPVMFAIAATEGAAYPLAGIMSIALVFAFVLEYEGIGD